MDYEIYKTTGGHTRVNIGNVSYELAATTHGTPYTGQRGMVGEEELHAWVAAAKEVGVPARYAWEGVINALGHHNRVMPPWKAREKNFNRAG